MINSTFIADCLLSRNNFWIIISKNEINIHQHIKPSPWFFWAILTDELCCNLKQRTYRKTFIVLFLASITYLTRLNLLVSRHVLFLSRSHLNICLDFTECEKKGNAYKQSIEPGKKVKVNSDKVTIYISKGPKIIVYKYKAKKNYRRTQGHRQPYTRVEI